MLGRVLADRGTAPLPWPSPLGSAVPSHGRRLLPPAAHVGLLIAAGKAEFRLRNPRNGEREVSIWVPPASLPKRVTPPGPPGAF